MEVLAQEGTQTTRLQEDKGGGNHGGIIYREESSGSGGHTAQVGQGDTKSQGQNGDLSHPWLLWDELWTELHLAQSPPVHPSTLFSLQVLLFPHNHCSASASHPQTHLCLSQL